MVLQCVDFIGPLSKRRKERQQPIRQASNLLSYHWLSICCHTLFVPFCTGSINGTGNLWQLKMAIGGIKCNAICIAIGIHKLVKFSGKVGHIFFQELLDYSFSRKNCQFSKISRARRVVNSSSSKCLLQHSHAFAISSGLLKPKSTN